MIDACKAIWNGFKWLLGILKGIFDTGWGCITGLITCLAAVWASIVAGVADVVSAIATVWSALSGNKTALASLVTAGVPAPVVTGAAYIGNFVPIQFIFTQCVLIFACFVGAAIVRIVKSWLPTVA